MGSDRPVTGRAAVAFPAPTFVVYQPALAVPGSVAGDLGPARLALLALTEGPAPPSNPYQSRNRLAP
jgi:hypothetical protein